MFKIRRDFETIIKRHRTFVSCGETDRPLYCVNVMGRNYAKAYENTFNNIPQKREMIPDDIVIEDFIKDVDNLINCNEEVDGEFFLPVAPYFYIPWTEAIIGCPVFAGKDSFYAEPFIDDWRSFKDGVDLSSSNKWMNKLVETKTALVEYLGDRYPISSSTHLRGPADMMAAALGQKRFPLELYDNPDKLKKMGRVYTETFIKIARTVNDIAKKSKFPGFVVNNYGIWTEEICQYFQDDANAFVSPYFYKEIILEEHLLIDSSFPSTLYHIHPISLFTVDELIKFPNLKIIEINREPEAIGPSTEEMLPVFKKIQESGKAALINYTDIDFKPEFIEKEVRIACDNLSYNGLCIYICAADVEDARRKTKAISGIFKI